MPQSLRRTWALIALALVAILPVAFLAMRDVVRDVFPRCATSLEPIAEARAPKSTGRDADPGAGFQFVPSLDYERDRVTHEITSRVVGGRLTLEGKDESGEPCGCGSMRLRSAGILSTYVRVTRASNPNEYVVVDGVRGTDGIGAFRLAAGGRHFNADRLFARKHLPALVVWLAIGALGIAYLRARKGIAYATRMHAWTEATLDEVGRIESDTGETLGALASGGRRVRAGRVLVAPSVTDAGALYRDVPIIARRDVAQGTHARWRDWTMRALRDAHSLCVISVACSVLALAARFLAA